MCSLVNTQIIIIKIKKDNVFFILFTGVSGSYTF